MRYRFGADRLARFGLLAILAISSCLTPHCAAAQATSSSGTVTMNNPSAPPLIKSGASGNEPIYARCAQLNGTTIVGYYSDTVTAAFGLSAVIPTGVTFTPSFPVTVATSTPASPTFVNVKVATTKSTPSGNYTLSLVGSGTEANPNGIPCSAYYGSISFDVFPVLSATHPTLMTLSLTGTPATGKAPVSSYGAPYNGGLTGTAPTSLSCVAGGVTYNSCPAAGFAGGTSFASNTGTFTLADPANPGTTPNPGTLANMQVLFNYVSPSLIRGYGTTASLPTATFGMSCYFTLKETDWGSATASPTTCKSVTYKGVTYSGTETAPFGGTLAGTHCKAFDLELGLSGAAQLATGVKAKFTPNANGIIADGTVSTITVFTGVQGTTLTPGKSGARDMSIIPAYVSGITLYKTQLDQVGTLVMGDTGAGVSGYRIGVYKGIGASTCAGYANPIVVGGCTPATPGAAPTCPAATYTKAVTFVTGPTHTGPLARPDYLLGLRP